MSPICNTWLPWLKRWYQLTIRWQTVQQSIPQVLRAYCPNIYTVPWIEFFWQQWHEGDVDENSGWQWLKTKDFSFQGWLQLRILFCLVSKVNSVQEACTKRFAVHILKFEISKSHERNETKNIRLLVFSFWSINLAFWCFLFCSFMWFARFQILICEPQSIWRKVLVLSWLYCSNPSKKKPLERRSAILLRSGNYFGLPVQSWSRNWRNQYQI